MAQVVRDSPRVSSNAAASPAATQKADRIQSKPLAAKKGSVDEAIIKNRAFFEKIAGRKIPDPNDTQGGLAIYPTKLNLGKIPAKQVSVTMFTLHIREGELYDHSFRIRIPDDSCLSLSIKTAGYYNRIIVEVSPDRAGPLAVDIEIYTSKQSITVPLRADVVSPEEFEELEAIQGAKKSTASANGSPNVLSRTTPSIPLTPTYGTPASKHMSSSTGLSTRSSPTSTRVGPSSVMSPAVGGNALTTEEIESELSPGLEMIAYCHQAPRVNPNSPAVAKAMRIEKWQPGQRMRTLSFIWKK